MSTRTIQPGIGYLKKLRLILTIVAVLVAVFGYVLGFLIGLDEGPEIASTIFWIFIIVDAAWYVPALILIGAYYQSLSDEIQDDEVIVRVGIVTKSVKHGPFRTVTNIKVNRGILDRYVFNLGSLNIQTAGMSGSTGVEESLVGLTDVQEIYDLVARRLRTFRGAMSPTAADSDAEPAGSSDAVLAEILRELKAIRRNTEG